MEKLQTMLLKIAGLAQEAGSIILSADRIQEKTHEKTGAADLVTEYDIAVELFLKTKLPEVCPGAVFYGEEEEENEDPNHGWAFVVDPIDGTTNFVRGIMQSSVYIGLALDGVVQAGVVYDPFKGELFTAARGLGAALNGSPIHVSQTPLSQEIFGMGTAIYRREYLEPTLHLTEQLFQHACDFRRLGSAALDICYVACGRTDVFFEYSLCPWDYAAASLILTEAGGHISTLYGAPLRLDTRCSVWASNDVNKDLLQELEI